MTLQQLRYFVQTAMSGSITAAANALYMRQPSLSKSISDLEGEMGVKLLERSAHGVTLTDEGEVFLARAREVIAQADLLEGLYRDVGGPHATLAVSVPHDRAIVQVLVQTFRQQEHGRFEMRVREVTAEVAIEDVHTQRSEVGVALRSGRDREGFDAAVRRAGLRFAPITSVRPLALVRRDGPLAGHDLLTCADLAGVPMVEYVPNGQDGSALGRQLLPHLPSDLRIQLSEWEGVRAAVRDLPGYAPCLSLSREALGDADLVAVPLDDDSLADVGVLSRPGFPLSEEAHAFVLALSEYGRPHVS